MHSVVTMLPMGQGAMNLIEIYDDSILVSLSLIDCGSSDSKKSKAACKKSLAHAARKMKERYNNGSTGIRRVYLDCLLLTHKDADHYNQLNKLFRLAFGGHPSITTVRTGYLKDENNTYYNDKYWNLYIHEIRSQKKGYTQMKLTQTVNTQFNYMNWQLKYTDKNMSMIVYWINIYGYLSININENGKKPIAISSRGKLYGPNGKQINIPQDYNELKEVFQKICKIYPEQCKCINKDIINNMFNNLKTDYKKIDNKIYGNKIQIPPCIKTLCIGGNKTESGSEFAQMEELLKQYSYIQYCDCQMQGSISLYGGFGLHIIQRMHVDDLMELDGLYTNSGINPSIKNNATSIVCALLSKDNNKIQKIVFSGDATVHTFYRMLIDIRERNKPIDYSGAIWTAPHHGAYTTLEGWIKNNQEEDEQVFLSLLQEVKPNQIIVSAGYENTHGHPCDGFVKIVETYFGSNKVNEHDIYVNENNGNKRGGAYYGFKKVSFPLYTMYTSLDREKKYVGYRAKIPPDTTASTWQFPNENLPEINAAEIVKIPVSPEIPSKGLFFRRK